MRSQDGDRCLTIFISLSDSVGDAAATFRLFAVEALSELWKLSVFVYETERPLNTFARSETSSTF